MLFGICYNGFCDDEPNAICDDPLGFLTLKLNSRFEPENLSMSITNLLLTLHRLLQH
jgi:hypothetical protein